MVAIYRPGETIEIGRIRRGVRLAGGGGVTAPYQAWFELVSTQTLYSGAGATDHLARSVLLDHNGTWIHIYRQAAQHTYDADGLFHIHSSTDQGATWTSADTTIGGGAVTNAPFVGHSTNDIADAIIMEAPNGDLLVHAAELQSGDVPKGTYQWRSTDGGGSWTDEGQINSDDDLYGGQDHTVVGSEIYITTVSEAWATPMAAHLYKSADNGATWTLVSVIASTTDNANETGIVWLGGNTLLTVLRDTLNAKTYQRISTDLGATWGALTDVTDALAVMHRPRMRIYSQEPDRVYLFGRDRLPSGSGYTVIYYSDDDGASWSPAYRPDATAYGDTGYCDMLRRTNGDFYMLSYAGVLNTAASIVEFVLRGLAATITTVGMAIDTAIVATSATNNYGASTFLAVGENDTLAGRIWRTLLKPDLPSIPTATILVARLRLRLSSEQATDARTLSAYRLKRVWVEGTGSGSATGDGATWNKYDSTNDWQTAGGFGSDDCEQSAIGALAFTATPALNRFYEWELSAAAVQDWIDGDIANNGLLIKAETETDDNFGFDSSEHATAAYRPQLRLIYA